MRLAVLLNGASGDPARQERAREVAAAFAALGIDVKPRLVPGAKVMEAAKAAVDAGAKVVAIGGGDGSVGAAAGALAGTGVPLAVLPMGTLNHFAIDAGIPLELAEAARIAVEGVAAAVDVAEVNGRVFVNNSSIGVYPRAVRARQRRPWSQGRWSKRLAMVAASWEVLRRLPSHRVVLEMEGRVAVRTTPFVFVGNNRYGTAWTQLGRRGSISGGLLCVYHLRRPGRGALLAVASRAAFGRLGRARDLEEDEVAELTIRARRATLRVAVDGEVERMATPLRYRIRPGALLLMRPPEAAKPGATRRAAGARKTAKPTAPRRAARTGGKLARAPPPRAGRAGTRASQGAAGSRGSEGPRGRRSGEGARGRRSGEGARGRRGGEGARGRRGGRGA